MGTSGNPTYYDGDLRADLIAASLAVIAESGPSAVSLRQLARDLGVSHAAPATWFPSKQALFEAIAAEGFQLLAAALRRAHIDADAPRRDPADDAVGDALRRAGVAYVTFALDHPAHFSVMFQPDLTGGTLVADGRAAFEQLLTIVGEAIGADEHHDPVVLRQAEASWAYVHGIATLLTTNALVVRKGQTALDLATELVSAAAPALLTRRR